MTKKLQNKWNDKLASKMSEPELLLYRSNLLGSDLRITNFGGGNTSAKIEMPICNMRKYWVLDFIYSMALLFC